MAESKTNKTSSGNAEPSKLKLISKQLSQAIAHQEALEEELNKLEHSIYSKETAYLQSTGNIIRGFDNYTGGGSSHSHSHSHSHSQSHSSHLDPIHPVSDSSRVFSLSSSTFVNQIREKKD